MPLYEYLCQACGRRTEVLQRVDEPPLVECPHCRGELRKLLSAPAFQFKGSGWYLTDYARKSAGGEKGGEKGGGKAGDDASSSPSTEAASSAGGGDAKPGGAAKPPAAPKPSADGGD
jgi:putative FmdB family regulatory protein